MNTLLRKITHIGLGLLMAATVLGAALQPGRTALAASAAAPAGAASYARLEATLPAATCSLVGLTRTCELWATTGTLTLVDGAVVPIWGYTDVNGGSAQLPGPTLIANEGETIEIILHNTLTFTTSLSVPGQDLVPDLDGIAPGGTKTYTFTAANVGTYAYEAGLSLSQTGFEGYRQVMMGLFGALIVRPAGQPTWAYSDAGSAFDDEALLVFSEIDPAFNAAPDTFPMIDYQPRYWLINGQSYSQTATILTAPGNTVLLRYLNAGVQERTIGLLGLRQTVLGEDSSALPVINRYTVVAETLGAGQALDTLAQIPVSVTVGTLFPLYNTGLQQLHNNGQLSGGTVAFGGIITFLEVVGGSSLPDVGPLASAVTVSPNPATGLNDVILSAVLDETTTGASNVVAAEYFTDTLGAEGSGIPITVPVPGVTVNVSATISAATLSGWPHGDITFYVRGQDANGNWGPVSSDVLDLVKTGPEVRGMSLTPTHANGTRSVAIQATADDSRIGEVDVVAAEYFIDAPGVNGSGNPMNLNMIAPLVSLNASIPAATVNALPEGDHTIYIHAQDALGNWGDFATIALVVDKTGPLATGLSLGPNPNNGTLSINSSSYAVRLEASFSDMGVATSPIARAEGFIDTAGATGSGFPFFPRDAVFNGITEPGFVDIPLSTIRMLSPGEHTILFRAMDAAGNWGSLASMSIIIDKTGPASSNLYTVPPDPLPPAITFITLFGDITDPPNGSAPASSLAAAEWFRGTDPGKGSANPMTAFDGAFDSPNEQAVATINVGSWPNGTHVIYVRGKDRAGNWGEVISTTINVSGNVLAALLVNGFETGDLTGWAAATGGVSVSPEAAMDGGQYGLRAPLNGLTPAYVVDETPTAAASYHVSFFFDPNSVDTFGEAVDIFVGRNADNAPIFGIQFESSAGIPEVRAWALSNGSPIYTAWHDIADAPQKLELVWWSQTDGSLSLWLDGVQLEALNGLDTSADLLEKIWLGPSQGLTGAMSGVFYFDGFNSRLEYFNITRIYLPMMVR